jgi:hypothetical protein
MFAYRAEQYGGSTAAVRMWFESAWSSDIAVDGRYERGRYRGGNHQYYRRADPKGFRKRSDPVRSSTAVPAAATRPTG